MQTPIEQVHGSQSATTTIMLVGPQTQNQTSTRTKKTQIVLGSFQIFLGLMAIIFNVVAIIVGAETAVASHGIWGGVIFILAGSFQIMAGKTSTRCWIITSMVFSIIAAVFCIPVLVLSAVGIPIDKDNESQARRSRDYYYEYQPEYHRYRSYPYWDDLDKYDARYAMNGVLVTIGILEGTVAIISSILGCKSLCCGGASQRSQVQLLAHPSQPGQPMMIMTSLPGNQLVYQNQTNGQSSNSTQPGLLPIDQTMQPTHQVPLLTGTMQSGFTFPVLTTVGAPPAYSYIQPAPSASETSLTQNQPAPEPEKSPIY